MSPGLVSILLCTLLGAALGNSIRCPDCEGGPSNPCKEPLTSCGEADRCKPQPGLGQIKLSANPCVSTHRCTQESAGDGTYAAHKSCCLGDLCNSAVGNTAGPLGVLAAATTTILAWLLPGLWIG
ncbi:lymphocyte antigen 6 complex locus protein G6d [Ctenodactylus gundi]